MLRFGRRGTRRRFVAPPLRELRGLFRLLYEALVAKRCKNRTKPATAAARAVAVFG